MQHCVHQDWTPCLLRALDLRPGDAGDVPPLLDKAEDLASAAHQSVLERHIVECLQAITHMDAAYG
jgi:hypothetical protein